MSDRSRYVADGSDPYVEALEKAYVTSAMLWSALNRIIPGTQVVCTAQDEATAKGQLIGLREAFAATPGTGASPPRRLGEDLRSPGSGRVT